MTITVYSDVAGGYIAADGVPKIIFDAAGNVSFGITGEFKFIMRKTAPAGWIIGNGQTIGAPGSGATRANVDTLALFTLWWTDYTDAQLPIQTSAGGASTRGATVAADWAAGKRLTVFDMTDDRFPVGANGAGTINGTKYADQLQNITGGWVENYGGLQANSGTGAIQVDSGSGAFGNNTNGSKGTFATFDASRVARTGSKTLPPRIGMLPCWKL